MPISVIRKFLQLIKSEEEIPEEVKPSEETLESNLSESEEEMQNGEGEMENAKCRMQNAKCEMKNAECKMKNAKCKMQNAECEMQNADEELKAPGESNRALLTSSVPRSAKPPQGILTKGELAEIRALFSNLDDKEIQRLYKQVTK